MVSRTAPMMKGSVSPVWGLPSGFSVSEGSGLEEEEDEEELSDSEEEESPDSEGVLTSLRYSRIIWLEAASSTS